MLNKPVTVLDFENIVQIITDKNKILEDCRQKLNDLLMALTALFYIKF